MISLRPAVFVTAIDDVPNVGIASAALALRGVATNDAAALMSLTSEPDAWTPLTETFSVADPEDSVPKFATTILTAVGCAGRTDVQPNAGSLPSGTELASASAVDELRVEYSNVAVVDVALFSVREANPVLPRPSPANGRTSTIFTEPLRVLEVFDQVTV